MIKVKRLEVGAIQTNCYIISSDFSDMALVVDPGGNYEQIIAEINSLNKRVGAVLLTHAHFDHVLETHKFNELGAKVYLHKNDIPFVNSDGNLARIFGFNYTPFIVDNELIEGLFDICGFKVRVIETPGHTDGSVCFLIDDLLFSGDTLFNLGFGRTDFPSGSSGKLYNSIKKLFALEGDYKLYPGHGFTSTLNYERLNNPALDYLRQ